MKSFVEYVQIKEVNLLRGAMGAYQYYTKDAKSLENNAIQALQNVINELEKSEDGKLKYLYNSGYAYKLWQIIQYLQKNQPEQQQEPAQQEPKQQEPIDIGWHNKTEGVGSILAGAGGAILGGLAGGPSGAMLGGYGAYKVANAWPSRALRAHNRLEATATKALQALLDRVLYEKSEKYYSGYAKMLQFYINWMNKAREFINSSKIGGVGSEQGREPLSYETRPRGRRFDDPDKNKKLKRRGDFT